MYLLYVFCFALSSYEVWQDLSQVTVLSKICFYFELTHTWFSFFFLSFFLNNSFLLWILVLSGLPIQVFISSQAIDSLFWWLQLFSSILCTSYSRIVVSFYYGNKIFSFKYLKELIASAFSPWLLLSRLVSVLQCCHFQSLYVDILNLNFLKS